MNNKVDSNKQTLEAYDAIAPVYDEYSQKKQAYLESVEKQLIANLDPNIRLLDVGAGDGRRLKKIMDASSITDCAAIEPSKNMAKICREQAQVTVYEELAENINTLDLEPFDVAIALWNVFGHIPSSDARLKSLENIANLLKKDGLVILDVNNRHNASAYGQLKVLGRRIVDGIYFNEERGDAYFDWEIGEQSFKGSGHLFTPAEIEDLFKKAKLKIKQRLSINYLTGEISSSPYKGQLFYILTHI